MRSQQSLSRAQSLRHADNAHQHATLGDALSLRCAAHAARHAIRDSVLIGGHVYLLVGAGDSTQLADVLGKFSFARGGSA